MKTVDFRTFVGKRFSKRATYKYKIGAEHGKSRYQRMGMQVRIIKTKLG